MRLTVVSFDSYILSPSITISLSLFPARRAEVRVWKFNRCLNRDHPCSSHTTRIWDRRSTFWFVHIGYWSDLNPDFLAWCVMTDERYCRCISSFQSPRHIFPSAGRYEFHQFLNSKQTGHLAIDDGLPLCQVHPLHFRLRYGWNREIRPQIQSRPQDSERLKVWAMRWFYLFHWLDLKDNGRSMVTRPSRPIGATVWIVNECVTNRPTDRHSQL